MRKVFNLSMRYYISRCQKEGGPIIRGGAILGGNTVFRIEKKNAKNVTND